MRTGTRERRRAQLRRDVSVVVTRDERSPRSLPAVDLDAVAARWQLAIDAAQRADELASAPPIRAQAGRGGRAFANERLDVGLELAELARLRGIGPVPWLPSVPVTSKMLGLRPTTKACLFDLDGVLTDSGVVHALAWAEVLDDLLLRTAEKTGWPFVPFDREADYAAWLDGKSRLEGVHAFLAGRGIRLPEGHPGDPANADTAFGLARRKAEAVQRVLHRRGISALSGARRYLEAAGHAGLPRAVVSASATTLPMLELAGLANLVEARVDAEIVHGEHLRSRPAPDVLLAACRQLGVCPEDAVTFTHTPAGVAAGRTAELAVVGVAPREQAETLAGFGAQHVVERLDALLDRRLAAGR
jgi:beta-phosphoglucomutase-like phosphatase (HAD superfamily)